MEALKLLDRIKLHVGQRGCLSWLEWPELHVPARLTGDLEPAYIYLTVSSTGIDGPERLMQMDRPWLHQCGKYFKRVVLEDLASPVERRSIPDV